MSIASAPIETTSRYSPSPSATPSILSALDNTPERPLTPQLAQHTGPFEDDLVSTFGGLSAVDYNQEVEENPYTPPTGFIPNNHDGHLFYPVYVKDSHYDSAEGTPHTMIAPYIQYSPYFTKVMGTEGIGFEHQTIPVYIGRRSRAVQKMTTEKWKYLQQDTNTKFVVNDALAEIGDPRLTGKVNHFRGLTDVKDTLNKLMCEATQQVNEIM